MKILVGHNGAEKPASYERLATAYQQAIALNGEVHVLTTTPHSPDVTPDKTKLLETELENIRQKFENKKIRCCIKLLTTSLNPAEEIIRYANDHDIDEIIISATKRSRLGKLLMGSTAQFVILEAKCNVMVVKEGRSVFNSNWDA